MKNEEDLDSPYTKKFLIDKTNTLRSQLLTLCENKQEYPGEFDVTLNAITQTISIILSSICKAGECKGHQILSEYQTLLSKTFDYYYSELEGMGEKKP